jgi:hypothetical protein
MTRTAPGRALALVLLAGLLAVGAGCQQLAWILSKSFALVTPEEESVAEHSFQGKSVLVLVDSQDSALEGEFPRVEQGIARQIVKILEERKAAGPIVPARSVDAARRVEPGFDKWSVAEAGRFFNVDLVLHIQLTNFRIKDTPESSVFHGCGEAVCQIVAAESGQKVWPTLAAARIIRAESVQGTEPEEAPEMEQMMVEGLADKIARHFFTYKKEELPLKPKVK